MIFVINSRISRIIRSARISWGIRMFIRRRSMWGDSMLRHGFEPVCKRTNPRGLKPVLWWSFNVRAKARTYLRNNGNDESNGNNESDDNDESNGTGTGQSKFMRWPFGFCGWRFVTDTLEVQLGSKLELSCSTLGRAHDAEVGLVECGGRGPKAGGVG